jgi:hypothetical protein
MAVDGGLRRKTFRRRTRTQHDASVPWKRFADDGDLDREGTRLELDPARVHAGRTSSGSPWRRWRAATAGTFTSVHGRARVSGHGQQVGVIRSDLSPFPYVNEPVPGSGPPRGPLPSPCPNPRPTAAHSEARLVHHHMSFGRRTSGLVSPRRADQRAAP